MIVALLHDDDDTLTKVTVQSVMTSLIINVFVHTATQYTPTRPHLSVTTVLPLVDIKYIFCMLYTV